MVEKLRSFVSEAMAESPELASVATMLLKEIDTKRGDRISHSRAARIRARYQLLMPAELDVMQIPDNVMAEQLTLIDSTIFNCIQNEELLNQAWSKSKLMHRANNVCAIVERLNNLTNWLASELLLRPSVKARAELWSKFVNVARILRGMGNFHSLMGFIAAFNLASVQRLKHTRALTKKKTAAALQDLEALMNPSSSWRTYRQEVNNARLPCIPYIGVYLSDLTFIEDGNPNMIGKKINFSKQELIWKVLSDIVRYQCSPYAIAPQNPAYSLLSALPSLSSDELYALSLLREPRGCELKDLK